MEGRKRQPKPKVRPSDLEASRRLAKAIARVAEERNCRDIVILEVGERSPVADHFVIATGTSEPQIRAVAREIEAMAGEHGFKLYGQAGMQQGQWAVLDFVDVVVHIFDGEYRRFYDLELLWGDMPKVDWHEKSE